MGTVGWHAERVVACVSTSMCSSQPGCLERAQARLDTTPLPQLPLSACSVVAGRTRRGRAVALQGQVHGEPAGQGG